MRNIKDIINAHSGGDVSIYPGVVFVDYGSTAAGAIFFDKDYIDSLDEADRAKINEKSKAFFSSELKPNQYRISWSPAAWRAAVTFVNKNTATFKLSDLPPAARLGEPLDLGDYTGKCLVVMLNKAEGWLLIDESLKSNSDFSQRLDLIGSSSTSLSTRYISKNDMKLVHEHLIIRVEETGVSDSDAYILLDEILTQAVRQEASDIHIFAYRPESGLPATWSTRVAKMMLKREVISYSQALQVSRVAWRGPGSVNDKDFKEDSSRARTLEHRVLINGRPQLYKFRFQSSQIEGGFKVVMRLINGDVSSIGDLTHAQLGYEDFQAHQLQNSLKPETGMVLMVGATNSGKTTTVTKLLFDLNDLRDYHNIDSIEDPVEQRLPFAAQHYVNLTSVDGRGMNEKDIRAEAFSKKLLDLLRMDPNTINMGEIRDKVSAEICEDIVRTGHKIFGTLHAKSAIGAFPRLNRIGMPYETTGEYDFLTLIAYQKLIPKTCLHCGIPLIEYKMIDQKLYSSLFKILPHVKDVKVRNPDGCQHCNRGVKGQVACCEIIVPDEQFCDLVREGRIAQAKSYWENDMPINNSRFEYQGRTMTDVIAWKVYQGIICPRMSEGEISGTSWEDFSEDQKELDRINKIVFKKKLTLLHGKNAG